MSCFSGEGVFGRRNLGGVLMYEFVMVALRCVCTMLVCICVEFAVICCCVTVSGCVSMLVV